MPEVIYQVEDPRKHDAQQKASREGKIECSILAAVIDVSGQVPERQMSSAKRHDEQPDNYQDGPENNQHLSEFAHAFSFRAGPPNAR
jgi:hypothetical protein